MTFLIADTFRSSLARLTAQEQKAAKTTAFDLQIDPSGPGLSFHKLDRAQDKNFWSVRVNSDLRIIVHRTAQSFLLAYVGHHDDAYAWAERRKLEAHPATGAMQIVELVPVAMVQAPALAPIPAVRLNPVPVDEDVAYDGGTKATVLVLRNVSADDLLAYGTPPDWIEPLKAATEDSLLEILPHLPAEAREAVLKLAVGETPEVPAPLPTGADPFSHPDAQRRFRAMANVEELRAALDAPWEVWAVFLHPAQEALTKRVFNGPARVGGSAGTGKTIVAVHRAVHLARAHPEARVLLTTFTKALAHALRNKIAILTAEDPGLRERIRVASLDGMAFDLYTQLVAQPNFAPISVVRTLVSKAAKTIEGHKFPDAFVLSEFQEVVDAWQLKSWDAYRNVARIGRRSRISEKQREVLWSIFEKVRAGLFERNMMTWSDVYGALSLRIEDGWKPPFDFAIVDEYQDLSVSQARFLAQFAGMRENAVFLAGDIGQQIFQQPFSWKALGLDIRGRSAMLKINYRTSQQIRSQADKLLPGAITDVDGNEDKRRGTISLFEGPDPTIALAETEADEAQIVADWITGRLAEGIQPEQMAVFVRSETLYRRVRTALKRIDLEGSELTEKAEVETGKVPFATMHLAKGHEFRAVAVIACDEDVIPSSERIALVGDEAMLESVFDSERHLLYVACTRARDHLLVTGVQPGSLFLADMV
jgi:superfamily I DNA/RNA helicase